MIIGDFWNIDLEMSLSVEILEEKNVKSNGGDGSLAWEVSEGNLKAQSGPAI